MCSEPTNGIEADGIEYRFETLDSEGDVILSVHDSPCDAKIDLLACSRILTLASPVFSVMFSSNFQEGIRVRRGDRPVVSLEERDVQAMELLLRILHHQAGEIAMSIEPKVIAAMAIQSDKYHCNKALRPWIEHWCNEKQKLSTPEDLGYMLMATYLFESSNLSNAIVRAAKQLKPNSVPAWREHEVLSVLPETLTGNVYVQTVKAISNRQQLH
ncbi:hypothetical protein PoMZ_13640 [Pyricularia oryzae]|uniref:BTB domain-containing protein n=1 Tax=Pyricularia oryzae TaxID=318829 RepID=A0A4P7NVN9_PYROR|nr:hypothetical protein PoMZ_13640 [Pyricularia oryzae]